MKTLTILLLAALLIPAYPAYAQTALVDLEPEAYFDFWLGNWDLTWEDSDGFWKVHRAIWNSNTSG